MNGSWNDPYNQNPRNYQQNRPFETQFNASNNASVMQTPPSNSSFSTASGAEGIMSMYPLASVAPVNQAGRHLALPSAPPPSFIRPFTSSSLAGAMDYSATSRAAPRPPPSNGWAVSGPPQALPQPNAQGHSYPTPQFWEQHEPRIRSLLNEQHVRPADPETRSEAQNYYPLNTQPHYQVSSRNQHPTAYEPPAAWAPSQNRPQPFVSNLLNSAPYAPSYQTHPSPNVSKPTPSSLSGALIQPQPPRPTSGFQLLPSRQSSGWVPNGANRPPMQLPPLGNSSQNGFGHSLRPNASTYPSARPTYSADESDDFLENFLDQTTRQRVESGPRLAPRSQMTTAATVPVLSRTSSLSGSGPNPSSAPPPSITAPSKRPKTPPPALKFADPPQESPDPLALTSSHVPPITPRKRKHEDPPITPSMKRLQSSETLRLSQAHSKTTPNGPRIFTPKGHEVYVELPRIFKSGATPSSNMKRNATQVVTPIKSSSSYRGSSSSVFSDVTKTEDSPDELGLRSINSRSGSTLRGSVSKTGERDDRGPLEKLSELLEDIFEAEDSLPHDTEESSLRTNQLGHFFSRLTVDYSQPLLNTSVIIKLTKSISQVARPGKRHRISSRDGNVGTPAHAEISQLDMAILSRMLKLFGRSVQIGEDLDPFYSSNLSAAPPDTKPAKPKKAKGKKKLPTSSERRSRSKSRTPVDDNAEDDPNEDVAEGELTDEHLMELEKQLVKAKESLVATEGCFALLCADKLPKQLYGEELLASCMTVVKNQLVKIVYPLVEAMSDLHGQMPALLSFLVGSNTSAAKSCFKFLGEIFQIIGAILPRINMLLSRTDLAMSDSIVIQAVYVAIGPFFNVDSGSEQKGHAKGKTAVILNMLGGTAALRALRLLSLSLIRTIFASYPDQRSWIIEEILTSLTQISNLKSKGGHLKMRNGRSIHTTSALLLQLVQTSAHDVRTESQRFSNARLQALSAQMLQPNTPGEGLGILSQLDKEEILMYNTALDSTTAVAKTIISFLTTRQGTGKGKATKSTKEADYRAIFDNLMQDLLTVLFWPEWPAASFMLGVAMKYLISALDDVKNVTSATMDGNGAKSMALDHLGTIAARLRATKARQRASDEPLLALEEIVVQLNLGQLERLIAARDDLSVHLVKRSSEDQAYDSARELTAAMWGQELARALSRCEALVISQAEELDQLPETDVKVLHKMALRLQFSLQDLWKETTPDVFDVGTEAEINRLDQLSEELGSLQRITLAHESILTVILNSLDAPVVFMRTKGLRALGVIIQADPIVLRKANVKQAIENHLHDQSPAVRDAAIELIGKYVVQSPELSDDYYEVIADRIADTGVSVRKRIVKLLKSMYDATSTTRNRQIDIAVKLVSRMSDDDDSVKDLSVKSLEEVWFAETKSTNPDRQNGNRGRSPVVENVDGDYRLSTEETYKGIAAVITGVAMVLGDRHSPLEDFFHQVATTKLKHDSEHDFQRFKGVCDALIESLVDALAEPGFNPLSCMKTVHILASAYPRIITIQNARSLLPYLTSISSREDQGVADQILRIYCSALPHLPKTAISFAQELQTILAARIQKPQNPQVLPENIACFYAVIKHMTHDYGRVIGLMKSCNARVRALTSSPAKLPPQSLRALVVIVFMISLLCEHCDFDALRQNEPDFADEINSISTRSITDHVYDTLLGLHDQFDNAAVRGPLLRCLGYLFRAQPTLMTRPQSADMMDAIFLSSDDEGKGRILKLMQEFLISESEKHADLEKSKQSRAQPQAAVNMDELVGNTDGFAESGVSSAIVQRYLPHILEASLSTQIRIQAIAVDIVGFTVKQGLAHPLQCLPVIVALETSLNKSLSSRASALHSVLYHKHASLVNSRHLESARKSFDYQSRIAQAPVCGYRFEPNPTSLLHRWYSLVREKRGARSDFLKALSKCFDIDPLTISVSQNDVDFVRYMAENLSALDYKTQEEVLAVIKHTTEVLSVAGMQIFAHWQPSSMEGGDQAVLPAQSDAFSIARASVSIAILLLLKAFLKQLYGLSEDKCAKWVPGKKSALGDKPAVKRGQATFLSWEKLPHAMRPIVEASDIDNQRQDFIALWEEDGVQPEPDNDHSD